MLPIRKDCLYQRAWREKRGREAQRSVIRRKMIVGLFTNLRSAGGVQRAGRHVAAVAANFAAERGFAYRFLSLNDPSGLHTVRVGPYEFLFAGHARNKAQFGLAALRA